MFPIVPTGGPRRHEKETACGRGPSSNDRLQVPTSITSAAATFPPSPPAKSRALAGFTEFQKFGVEKDGLIRLPITLVPVFLVDRLGRRPLMIVSTLISFLSLATIMGIDVGEDLKVATLIGLSTLLLINACGLGSVSRFYAAELVPRALLLPCVSTLNTFESLSKIAVEFAFYPIANIIGGQSLLMFLLPTAIFIYFMWLHCPETSRRPVNEVLNDIASRKRLNINFPSYGKL